MVLFNRGRGSAHLNLGLHVPCPAGGHRPGETMLSGNEDNYARYAHKNMEHPFVGSRYSPPLFRHSGVGYDGVCHNEFQSINHGAMAP
jgi:hypothetical protein